MEEREYCVYKHECPNGKVYIGITCQKLNLRWNGGHGYDTQFFGKAVRKYGWANIKHEILFSGLSLKIFKSIVEASKETGIGKTNIGSVCKHRTHLAGGYKWQYANEYNSDREIA